MLADGILIMCFTCQARQGLLVHVKEVLDKGLVAFIKLTLGLDREFSPVQISDQEVDVFQPEWSVTKYKPIDVCVCETSWPGNMH